MITRKRFSALLAGAFAVLPATTSAMYKLRNENDPDLAAEARSAVEAETRGYIEEFISEATSAELLFLRDVFERRSGPARLAGAELPLLDAFQRALHRNTGFVEVPAEYSERTALFVEGFADAARAAA